MYLQFKSEFSINSIVLISSSKENESGLATRLTDDLCFSTMSLFIFKPFDVNSADEFWNVIKEINNLALKGTLPIVHFHMHGSSENGLQIGKTGEYIAWEKLINALRAINVLTGNNLCVVSSACHALHMIKPIQIEYKTPFYILIAPEHKISFGIIDDHMSAFYSELFKTKSIDKAYEKVNQYFQYFHCEEFIIKALVGYVANYCRGKGKQDRKERLLTQGVNSNKNINKKEFRRLFDEHLKPNDDLIKYYIDRFAFNKEITISLDDIKKFINKK